MDKKKLRLTTKHLRNSMLPADREQAGAAIANQIANLPAYQKAASICLYLSTGSEVPTQFMLTQAWKANKRVYVPRITNMPGHMNMVAVTPNSPLTTGPFGIQEPAATLPAYNDKDFDIVVVPALAYDRQGYRLGYGGGYYDRFLAGLPKDTLTIGWCYHTLLFPNLPHDEHDCRVQMIITEREVIDLR